MADDERIAAVSERFMKACGMITWYGDGNGFVQGITDWPKLDGAVTEALELARSSAAQADKLVAVPGLVYAFQVPICTFDMTTAPILFKLIGDAERKGSVMFQKNETVFPKTAALVAALIVRQDGSHSLANQEALGKKETGICFYLTCLLKDGKSHKPEILVEVCGAIAALSFKCASNQLVLREPQTDTCTHLVALLERYGKSKAPLHEELCRRAKQALDNINEQLPQQNKKKKKKKKKKKGKKGKKAAENQKEEGREDEDEDEDEDSDDDIDDMPALELVTKLSI